MSFSAVDRRPSIDLEQADTADDLWLTDSVSPKWSHHVSPPSEDIGLQSVGRANSHPDTNPPTPRRTLTSRMRDTLAQGFSKANGTEGELAGAERLRRVRVELILTLFDLDEPNHAHWPGCENYLAYLEAQVRELWCGPPQSFFAYLGYSNPIEVCHGLEIIIIIAESFKAYHKNGLSISEVFESIVHARRGSDDRDPRRRDQAVRVSGEQAIFAAIGWLTMLYRPAKATSSSFTLHCEHQQTDVRKSHVRDAAKRPISAFLRELGNVLPIADPRFASFGQRRVSAAEAPRDWRLDQIHSSILNYYALKRLGHINIEWTDTLSAHLEFLPSTRTLMMFRYPSFCALNCLGAESDHCFDRILKDCYSSYLSLPSYKREVLLSYRLIFGQHRRSRKLYQASEVDKATGQNDRPDQLLNRLCGESLHACRQLPTEIWPVSCLDPKKGLLEPSVYSCEVHFPLLGSRLLNLQQFSQRQSPSRLWDIWRDRRNPTQWFTLWAVIVLGLISVVLQLVQVVLAGAQLAK